MTDDTRDDSLLRAQQLSSKWGTRLDDFELPCPLCRGHLNFHGVGRSTLYEFAEGEAGVVTPLHVLPILFICNRCGYTAEFDAELFNPSYLARLQGETQERIEALQADDFRVIVSLSSDEKSDTLLDVASALCGVRDGEVIVMNVNTEEKASPRLADMISRYTPPRGNPTPVHLIHKRNADPGSAILEVARSEKCDALILGWRGWTRNDRAVIGTVIDPVLRESTCDVILVNDHGLPKRVDRILLLTAGGPNARVAMPYAIDLAKAFETKVHVLSVVSPDLPTPEATGRASIEQTLTSIPFKDLKYVEQEVKVSAQPIDTIIQEAQRYSLLMIGAEPRNWRGEIRADSFVSKVTRNIGVTSMIVRGRQNLVGSVLQRFFGRK
jgi:nucleotide-binding universal stress UspA family protein